MNDARGVWLLSWPAGSARHMFADAPYLASNPEIGWLPDNRRFVMNGYPLQGGTNRLLMADLRAGTIAPLTGGQEDKVSPSVSPDGSRIAFVSRRSGLDLIQFPMDGGAPEPLVATSRTEQRPDISLSGVLAYVTDASGIPEVRVQAGADSWRRARSAEKRRCATAPPGRTPCVCRQTASGPPSKRTARNTSSGSTRRPADRRCASTRRRPTSTDHPGRPTATGSRTGGCAMDAGRSSRPRSAAARPCGWTTRIRAARRPIGRRRGSGSRTGAPTACTSSRRMAPRNACSRSPVRARSASRDGSRLIAVRRAADQHWELTTWDVAADREPRIVALPLATTVDIQGMALSADNAHIVLATGTLTSDIWFLEQFQPAHAPWARWLRR